ncbi:MAG: hypothetical protein NVS2B4_18000 [Ramlibacter sp.]
MDVPDYGTKSTMESMTTGQLAAAAGVNVETVRTVSCLLIEALTRAKAAPA